MSSRKLTMAANKIERMLEELNKSYSLDIMLEDAGFSKQCYERANEYGLFMLDDICRYDADDLKELYEYNPERLSTLARNVKRVYECPDYILGLNRRRKSAFSDYELDSILNGWDTAEQYDLDYLDSMADWDYSRGYSAKRIIDVDGFEYECDSEIESNLIDKLYQDDYFQALRGQNLEILYKKRKRGVWKKYKPDIVMLNQDDYIVIIEVKPLYNMPTFENIQKYKALADYCEENGYLYCMCDDEYRTMTDLEEFGIDEDIKDFIEFCLDEYGVFDYECYELLKNHFDYFYETYLKENIAATVVQCKLHFSKGDLAGGLYSLRIFKRKNSRFD